MIEQYTEKHAKPPSKRTIWLLGQQAAQNTRRTKAEARRTIAGQTGAEEPSDAQRLAAWEAQTVRGEVQTLSAVREQAERFTRPAISALDASAKARAARIAVAEVQKHHATWTMAQLRFEVHRPGSRAWLVRRDHLRGRPTASAEPGSGAVESRRI